MVAGRESYPIAILNLNDFNSACIAEIFNS